MPDTSERAASKVERIDAQTRRLLDTLADAHEALARIAYEDDPTTTVRVITAVEMDDDLREKARRKAEQLYGAPVILKERVDPSILGGIIFESSTHRFDSSVRAKLSAVKRGFATMQSRGEA